MEEKNETPTKDDKSLPPIVAKLAQLEGDALITRKGLADLFDRCEKSVDRAVDSGHLPPPFVLFGTKVWTVRCLVQHFHAQQKEAVSEFAEIKRKIRHLSP